MNLLKPHPDLQHAITQDCISNLSYLGCIYVVGKDVGTFLQGQLTCNMQLVTDTLSQPGAYCNAQGRVIATLIASSWQDGVLLLMPREIIPATLEILKKYSVFSKVTLTDHSEGLALIGFSGNTIEQKLSLLYPLLPTNPYQIISANATLLIKLPGQRYLNILDANLATTNWLVLSKGLTTVDSIVWHYLQLKQGFPNIYTSTQQKLLPHRINLPSLQAINFNKGCYMGQEIIARTHFKATLKHAMYLYQVIGEAALHPGEVINTPTAEVKIGEIVDCCTAPNQSQLVLAIMLIDQHQIHEFVVNHHHYVVTLLPIAA